MSKRFPVVFSILYVAVLAGANGAALAQEALACPTEPGVACEKIGPQAPRDISKPFGENPVRFAKAPPAAGMRLCDIHFHKPAENKIPGTTPAPGNDQGSICRAGTTLSDPGETVGEDPRDKGCKGVGSGDTIEVHWVYTTCDVEPAPCLSSCFSAACKNPQLRVEAQVFFLTPPRYPGADNWAREGYSKAPPTAGEKVEYLGSTTGPVYNNENSCSPFQATWNVRRTCRPLTLESLDQWCAHNEFNEDYAHGVRKLVTLPKLLSKIP